MDRMKLGLAAAPLALAIAIASTAHAATPVAPPPAPAGLPARPVVEDYFGTKVTDRFRYVEAKDAATIAWMKAQGAYSRSVFDSIPNRAPYLQKISAAGAAYGITHGVQTGGGRTFYLERKPGGDVYSLMVREADGGRRVLIDTAALIAKAGGEPQAIDYFQVSPDGSRVAAGISGGGSENSSLSVIDVASGKTIAGPVSRAQFGAPSWTDDGKALFFIRLQELGPNAAPSDKYLNTSAVYWTLSGEPVAVAGAATGKGPVADPVKAPVLQVIRHSPRALLVAQNGVQNEVAGWTAPLAAAAAGTATWKPAFTPDDAVTGFDASATTGYLLSHKDAPTFKVLAMPLDGDFAHARTVIPAEPGRVLESIHVASDAVYVAGHEGLFGVLLRLTPDGRVESVPLPFKGSIGEVSTDPDQPGAIIGMNGWTQPNAHFRYDPATRRFADLAIDTGPAVEQSRYAVREVMARAGDGTMVPLSIIAPAGPIRPRTVLLDAYGAYGISVLPAFIPRDLAFTQAGGVIAECHVRGGGELGDTWRLGGKDANKPNTWRDAIACGEALIAAGYTTKDQLAITGTSAGGIMVGRAATERPDLFAGAIARVGDTNATRSETMPSGPANIPEFGTVKDAQGFRNLYAMDAYQHVEDNGHYPAFLLTTGLNDPRVEPWEAAKMTARLMEVPGHAPVLLRVEGAAGHGMGTTKSTRDAEEADIAAFVFWRAGVPGWQPRP